jgi:hypothetical protein
MKGVKTILEPWNSKRPLIEQFIWFDSTMFDIQHHNLMAEP